MNDVSRWGVMPAAADLCYARLDNNPLQPGDTPSERDGEAARIEIRLPPDTRPLLHAAHFLGEFGIDLRGDRAAEPGRRLQAGAMARA